MHDLAAVFLMIPLVIFCIYVSNRSYQKARLSAKLKNRKSLVDILSKPLRRAYGLSDMHSGIRAVDFANMEAKVTGFDWGKGKDKSVFSRAHQDKEDAILYNFISFGKFPVEAPNEIPKEDLPDAEE